MAPDRDYFVTVSRLRLHVVEWGDPSAPALVLQHGGRDHARSWDFIAAAFADRYRVIAADFRGHGDSDWASDGNYDMADYVADFAQLVDALGLGQFDLVAHSLGGAVTTRYVGLFPDRVRRFVNIEGLGISDDPEPAKTVEELRRWAIMRPIAVTRTQLPSPDLDHAVARLQANNPRLTPEIARHLAVTGSKPGPGGLVFKYDPAMTLLPVVDLPKATKLALWQAITCPVLLIYGAESWAKNPAEDGRMAHLRDARVQVFDHSAHWIQHDQPAEFIAAVAAFLAA